MLGLSACSSQAPFSTPDVPDADAQEAAIEGLSRLQAADSDRPLQVRFAKDSGVAASIRGAFSVVGAPDDPTAARTVLGAAADLLGGLDVDTLSHTATHTADSGARQLRFQQHLSGLPVYGGELVVSVGDGVVTAILGGVSLPGPVPAPRLDGDAAVEAARVSAGHRGLPVEPPAVSAVVWDGARMGRDAGLRTAWLLEWTEVQVVVDAESGELLRFVDERHEAAFGARVQDHSTDSDLTGNLLYRTSPYSQSGCGTDCAMAVFYNYAIYNHWSTEHGRRSFDGNDGEMWTLIDGGYNNANARLISCTQDPSGTCAFTQYGRRYHSYDIFAHEWNHMLDKFVASDLDYQDASGALDEALADLKGGYLDGNWTVGEDATVGIRRDMADPPARGNPDHMDDYELDVSGSGCTPTSSITGPIVLASPANEDDNGCVHSNSGIIHKAVWLMVEGGEHTGVAVAGQGWSTIEPLLWDAQVNRLWSTADFDDFRDVMEESCLDSFGPGSAECVAVSDAFGAVGIGEAHHAGRSAHNMVSGDIAAADLDGDGGAEVLVGFPTLDVHTQSWAGAVAVHWSDGAGVDALPDLLTSTMLGGTSDSEAYFGQAIATGDFDADGDVDVAIGAPGRWISGRWDAGEVCWMVNDGAGGVADADCITQAGGTSAETDDEAGRTLAIGDFDCDGADDLAVGAPLEDWGSIVDTGAVTVHYSGGTAPGDGGASAITQATGGATNEAGDRFGDALAAGDVDGDGCDDLVVGVPYETNDFDSDAGAVMVFFGGSGGLGSDSQTMLPLDAGAGSEVEIHFGQAVAVGDFDNDGVDDLAVGAPDRDSGLASSAGAVFVFAGVSHSTLAYDDTLDQRPASNPETGDRFGAALAAGDTDGDGIDDLVLASPTESYGATTHSGLVQVRTGSSTGLSSAVSTWSSAALGSTDARDWWGEAVAVGPLYEGRGGFVATATGAVDDLGAACAIPGQSADSAWCVE